VNQFPADVIVTGGAGFIGSEFVNEISSNPAVGKIFVLDKLTYAANLERIQANLDSGRVELIVDDVQNSHSYKSIFQKSKFLIHFAAESHVDRSIEDGSPFIDSNIKGTYQLLETARINPELKTLIVSTDEVYGSIETGEADEETSLNPSSYYSASKASADLIAMAAMETYKQKIMISRCSNNYGPTQHHEKLIPNMLNALINDKNISIYGDGSNVREWIHVNDHVNALVHLLFKTNKTGIYNIGSGERLTNIELARMILNKLGFSDSRINYVEDRKGHDYRYALNSGKIRKEFEWKPKRNIENSLQDLVDTAQMRFKS
jgi:dTDP-glucose 4,6-dehydratase